MKLIDRITDRFADDIAKKAALRMSHFEVPKEDQEEKTKSQTSGGVGLSFSHGQPPRALIATYRLMRTNPTIALARAVATAPIKMMKWGIEADDDVPEERADFIKRQINGLWPNLIRNVLLALDYGYQPFEKVFQTEGGLIGYEKIKPLLPEITQILVDKDTGDFTGLKNKGVELDKTKSFLFVNEPETGNLFGRSRHENVRKDAWFPWNQMAKKREIYVAKAAGVIPMINYPQGEGRDAAGSLTNNFDIATALNKRLGKLEGIVMPKTYERAAGDLAPKGVDIAKLFSWDIGFLEAKVQHGKEFVEMMRHLESLMMRGWLVPERAALEGQFGTKAEAEAHGGLVIAIAGLVFLDIIEAVNAGLIDPLLGINWGDEAIGTVRMTKEGLDPVTQMLLREITKAVLTNPANADLFQSVVNIDALLDITGVPTTEETVRVDALPRAEARENVVQAAMLTMWKHANKSNGDPVAATDKVIDGGE